MSFSKRFTDEKLILSDFYSDVVVVCPNCGKKALATADHEKLEARLVCNYCGLNQKSATFYKDKKGNEIQVQTAAHGYFGADLWYQLPFKNELLWAYNTAHLDYLEKYIAAAIRENKERTGFSMVEKLPRFMQVAKNRDSLLKLIGKMRN